MKDSGWKYEDMFPLGFQAQGQISFGKSALLISPKWRLRRGNGNPIWYWSALIGNIQFSSISQDSDSIHLIGYPMPSRCSSQIHPVRGRCFALYVISCCLTTAFIIARIIFVWNAALIPNRRKNYFAWFGVGDNYSAFKPWKMRVFRPESQAVKPAAHFQEPVPSQLAPCHCIPKIDLSTTRASQQTETSKDLHLPKLYPNQINPIIPSHPTMPRGYSLHLPWPVRTKRSAAVIIFQWAGLTFGEVFPTRNTPGAWLVRTAKQKGSQMEHTSQVSWYFLNSPEWRILRRPPNGCRCRWFWGVTRVMWPNQATCTMYKMPILTTGLKAPPLVLRNKMDLFLLSCFVVGQCPISRSILFKVFDLDRHLECIFQMVEVFVILTLQVLSMDTVQTNALRISQAVL